MKIVITIEVDVEEETEDPFELWDKMTENLFK